MAEEWNRLAVRLKDTREERLRKICGVDEDGNLKREKSVVIRELIDKEYFQNWHIDILESVEDILNSREDQNYFFDMEKFLEKRMDEDNYLFNAEKLRKKREGGN